MSISCIAAGDRLFFGMQASGAGTIFVQGRRGAETGIKRKGLSQIWTLFFIPENSVLKNNVFAKFGPRFLSQKQVFFKKTVFAESQKTVFSKETCSLIWTSFYVPETSVLQKKREKVIAEFRRRFLSQKTVFSKKKVIAEFQLPYLAQKIVLRGEGARVLSPLPPTFRAYDASPCPCPFTIARI